MVKGKLFEKAREASKIKKCDGCQETKPISSFKKGNKYCIGCKYVEEIRENWKNKNTEIEPIDDFMDFFDETSYE
jgi:hypothetical protein